jgi:ubiquinone/menaquinone biosynthesis C-methylase UbiE
MSINLEQLIIAKNQNKNLEFEIRLGNYFNQRFQPGINYSLYNKIFEQEEHFSKTIIENTISFVGNNNIKKILFFNKDLKAIKKNGKIKVLFQEKKKLLELNMYDRNIRISVSEENNLTEDSGIKTLARYKQRISKITKDGNWRFDFTKVSTVNIKSTNDILPWGSVPPNFVYEVEIEFIGKKLTSEHINNELNYIESLLENNTYQNILGKLKSKFYLKDIHKLPNQVVGLKKLNFILIKHDYAAVDKADGERLLFYLNGESLYTIDLAYNVKKINTIVNKHNDSLIEGELVTIKGKQVFLVFDCLLFEGKDVRNKYLRPRLDMADKIQKYLNTLNSEFEFRLKDFYFETDIFKSSEKVLNSKYQYELDGIIYTPTNKPYSGENFKWKPSEFLTIDFVIKDVVPKVSKNKLRKVNLFVGIDSNRGYKLGINVPKGERYFPTKFRPLNMNNIDCAFVGSEYKNNTVVEFQFDKKEKPCFQWKPMRTRDRKTENFLKGKTFGNDYSVAVDVWNSINDPLTKEMIVGNKQFGEKVYFQSVIKSNLTSNMRKYHNQLKSILYSKFIPKNSHVLDIAGGKGADLQKYNKIPIGYLVINDIDQDALLTANDSAKNRYETIRNKNYDIDFVLGDAGKNLSNKISKSNLRVNKFDVINCQFAMHYFMKNKVTFNNFLNNVDRYLKVNGFLIGTAFDGLSIFNLMKNKKYIEFTNNNKTLFKIEKLYKNGKLNGFGKEIDVYIESIGTNLEYLLNFDFLTSELEKKGYVLIESYNFDKLYQPSNQIRMTEVEKEFSFLYRYFVFQKK